MKKSWIAAAYQLDRLGQAYVVATILGVKGSTPRNSGSKMLISEGQTFDTIGGGHLEHKVIKQARKLLTHGTVSQQSLQQIEHYELGVHLDQCCGGSVNILFEYFPQAKVNIVIFGAGHVGQALVSILAALPCQITWVDSRMEQFQSWQGECQDKLQPEFHPELQSKFQSKFQSEHTHEDKNLRIIIRDDPQQQVVQSPANSYYVVLTHQHQMDFEISQKILERGDFKYFGLIGSQTKWRRFQQRYQLMDLDLKQIERVNCPIGSALVDGKRPMEVAVSIAAEIISCYQPSQVTKKSTTSNAEKATKAMKPSTEIDWQQLTQMKIVEPTDKRRHLKKQRGSVK